MTTQESDIYIGMMSGTSMDGIDVVAVDFSTKPFTLLGSHSEPFRDSFCQSLQELSQPGDNEINRLGQLDRQMGTNFANACNTLLKKHQIDKKRIRAIGSHGQTIRHQPHLPTPFTLQIGDPNVIAELTGITTIADFRRRDIVCGGQGAPLTPAFHHFAFSSDRRNRVIVNVGGIANITLLSAGANQAIRGFDCGPGNTLLDKWIKRHLGKNYDHNGNWSKQGVPNQHLLKAFLADPYFQLPAPKSTGFEYFNLQWVEKKLMGKSIAYQDVQSTLAELTACCIMNAIEEYMPGEKDILLCGGGAYNQDLIARLDQKKGQNYLDLTSAFGVEPRWVEAIAFAWLARQALNKLPGNLPAVTGATKSVILGGIYPGR